MHITLIAFIWTMYIAGATAQGFYACRRNPRFLPPPTSEEGTEARAYSWPWMAGIYIQVNGGPRNFLCAGTLISHEHILTAAHCFSGLSTEPSNYVVGLRIHDILSAEDGEVFNVAEIKINENFKNGEFYDDIAIVRLSEIVKYRDGIAPVCLPPRTYVSPAIAGATTGVVTGWGDLAFGEEGNRTLHEITIPIVGNEECAETYSRVISISFPEGIDNSIMCTGQAKEGKDPCQGDSGGPLVVGTTGGTRWVQVGIVSFGQGCSAPGFPGLYTRVKHFRNWIYENTGV